MHLGSRHKCCFNI